MKKKCSVCGEIKKVASSKNGILCPNCYLKKNKEICSICGKLSPVNTRNNGIPICQECNRKKGICDICDKFKVIKKVIDDKSFCGSCRYKLNKEECSICGKVSQVAERIGKKAVCPKCYKERHKEKCNSCGRIRPVKSRKNGPVCERCYKRERIGNCASCKKLVPLNYNKNGEKICSNCYDKMRPTTKCSMCGEMGITGEITKTGPICRDCYRKERKTNNPDIQIKDRVRSRVRYAIENKTKDKRIQLYKDLYINIEEIIEFLGKCPGDMKDYHIDHIFPLSAFDLRDPIDFQISCAPENFQWLKISDNLRKGALYNQDDLEKFKKYIIEKYRL